MVIYWMIKTNDEFRLLKLKKMKDGKKRRKRKKKEKRRKRKKKDQGKKGGYRKRVKKYENGEEIKEIPFFQTNFGKTTNTLTKIKDLEIIINMQKKRISGSFWF